MGKYDVHIHKTEVEPLSSYKPLKSALSIIPNLSRSRRR